MLKASMMALAALLLWCCKSSFEHPSRGTRHFEIQYRYVDDQTHRKILLYYRNITPRAVCFGAENWPDNGVLLNTGDEVWLEIRDRKFFLKPEQDYCPDCVTKVLPGGEHTGFLSYESFNIPAELVSVEKRLSYRVIGYSCRR